MEPSSTPHTATLRRDVGLVGAVLLGLGSIVGTGVFVSIALAAGIAGPGVFIAVTLAALVAVCNGLSSAQLAAAHPMSGGSYEYGYIYLTPTLGFVAGWLFLLAKSASAATAALGFAGYLLDAAGIESAALQVLVGLAAVGALTMVTLRGIRRSNIVNAVIVLITLCGLVVFIGGGVPVVLSSGGDLVSTGGDSGALLHATALLFVAYTGYGRIATMGEEVKDPRRTIPRAMITTLTASLLLYLGVALVVVGWTGNAGGTDVGRGTAPLAEIATALGIPGGSTLLTIGAVTAMLGVLLNLVLGLSRVALAMGRRGDLPRAFAAIDPATHTPRVATIAVAVGIGALVLIGNVRLTWSFSAFTVLIYYAITNLAALRLPPALRLYPRWLAYTGLAACVFLAFRVDREVWVVGLGLIGVGLAWHAGARRGRLQL
jgi:APA family basic amino acid/polyamine antiporter